MTDIPNPWLSDSVADLPSVTDTAAAPDTNPESTGAAAGPLPVPAQETDTLGSEIGDIGEIFAFARLLVAEARIHPGTISQQAVAVAEEIKAYQDEYLHRDPAPLFLRRAG